MGGELKNISKGYVEARRYQPHQTYSTMIYGLHTRYPFGVYIYQSFSCYFQGWVTINIAAPRQAVHHQIMCFLGDKLEDMVRSLSPPVSTFSLYYKGLFFKISQMASR